MALRQKVVTTTTNGEKLADTLSELNNRGWRVRSLACTNNGRRVLLLCQRIVGDKDYDNLLPWEKRRLRRQGNSHLFLFGDDSISG